jgi:hypothetical protein
MKQCPHVVLRGSTLAVQSDLVLGCCNEEHGPCRGFVLVEGLLNFGW